MPWISSNPLLHRIKGHTRMATLFRSASSTSAPTWPHSWPLPADGPIAMSFLPSPQTPLSDVEEFGVAGGQHPARPAGGMTAGELGDAMPALASPAAGALSREPAPESARPLPHVARPAAPQLEPAAGRHDTVQRAAVPEQRAVSGKPAASDPSDVASRAAAVEMRPPASQPATLDHPTWERLETIYARHREKQGAAPELVEPSAVPTVTGAPIDDSSRMPANQDESGDNLHTITQAPMRAALQPGPAAQPPAVIQQQSESGVVPVEPAPALQDREALTAEVPLVPRSTAGANSATGESERQQAVSHLPGALAPAERIVAGKTLPAAGLQKAEDQQPATPLPSQPAGAGPMTRAAGVTPGDKPEQAAWLHGASEGGMAPTAGSEQDKPYSHKAGQAGGPPDLPIHGLPLEAVWPVQRTDLLPPAVHDSPAGGPVTVIAPPTVDADQTPAIVRDLPAAQPTDSAIEVIAPTRPRPTGAPSSQTGGASTTTAKPMTFEDTVPAPRQEREEASIAPPPAGGKDVVATEIGPLPADLWQLLEQQPPGTTRSELGLASSRSPHDVTANEHRLAGLATGAQPAQAVVQRQVDSTTTAGAAPAEGTESGHEPADTAAIDTSELARRVYAEIRRRLAVEWERSWQRR